MKRRKLIKAGIAALSAVCLPDVYGRGMLGSHLFGKIPAFNPTWESLAQYQVPDLFRDAKFGMWAHWGPKCQPERGDWYAREMYMQGSDRYKFHCEKYGFKKV